MTTILQAADRLAELEARRTQVETEQRQLRARQAEIDARVPELEQAIAGAVSVDLLRIYEDELAELNREGRVVENRQAVLSGQVHRLNQDLDAARRAAATEAVAAVMVEAEPVLERIRAACAEIVEIRRRAVASGAPEHLLPPTPDHVGRVRATTGVIAFQLTDQLLAQLEGEWATTSLPAARDLLGERQ